ncbi:hypothetical protein HB364_15045 [Pseudoflavitalea sp. X16]|uniref:hypothetical protein n=1 Tax=Paraflavitalea devenefica TaxID=2716334 RepID=UPI00141DD7E5|nr:hypothetical protein [Paraflavitalea devenefica]NII26404.1 hypothetical protein [Paraflavitalea devenefica]
MAKSTSRLFKFQGTIEDLTFVNSKRYKPHVRARKNSKKPFVMTAALAESKNRLQECNNYLQPVFQALRTEVYHGSLWSRLVKALFARLKAGGPLGLTCLQGFDCNLQHKLSELFTRGYDFSATQEQNQLRVRVLLRQHPAVNDDLPRTGYQVRLVAIFPDAENGATHKEVVLGPLTKYDAALEAVELMVPLPSAEAPGMLLLGMTTHLQGLGAWEVMSDSGMKVMWVQ